MNKKMHLLMLALLATSVVVVADEGSEPDTDTTQTSGTVTDQTANLAKAQDLVNQIKPIQQQMDPLMKQLFDLSKQIDANGSDTDKAAMKTLMHSIHPNGGPDGPHGHRDHKAPHNS